ncbi:MAG: flavodoxin-dependent (E)-4-hydroxy-3-methylbut-2-enyl-diphosphate synthase [Oscillospiraceae bacterium]|nr:flavodoxin-dependent (E)-4-hydroxy-3-methylbut-2-enyl-diphosphate synthase [Oscillospiraceae bacterium]
MFSKRVVKVGNLAVGGNNRVFVQSMLNKPSEDVKANLVQARELEAAGCDIIRVSIPNKESLNTLFALKNEFDLPVVADIHFDYKMAIESVHAGADKVRINPGNMGNKEHLGLIVAACSQKEVPIRIGVNSGSIPSYVLKAMGRTPEGLVAAARDYVKLLNSLDFDNIIISVKSSNVIEMIKAYTLLADTCDYPLHLGVTEAGTFDVGVIKSSIGIGSLLAGGVGDTIRVSLTEEPVKEVEVALNILRILGLRKGLNIISCPTCGRTKLDIKKIAYNLRRALDKCGLLDADLEIAVMGCAVNGPGEAKDADFGIAGGDGEGVIFREGKIIKKVREECLVNELVDLITLTRTEA